MRKYGQPDNWWYCENKQYLGAKTLVDRVYNVKPKKRHLNKDKHK